jgi:hypothetical protein
MGEFLNNWVEKSIFQNNIRLYLWSRKTLHRLTGLVYQIEMPKNEGSQSLCKQRLAHRSLLCDLRRCWRLRRPPLRCLIDANGNL